MHSLNDYEVWKQRAEEIRREVENNRLVSRGRPCWLRSFGWELRRLGGWLRKRFRGGAD